MANRNPAGLFRDNDRDRIRFFRDPKRGPMAQAETAIQCLALTHWKNASGRGDPAVANNYSAIMQRGFRMENAQDELDRKIGIEGHSGLLVDADRSVAFDREQRAELFVRQLSDSFGEIVHRLALLTRE